MGAIAKKNFTSTDEDILTTKLDARHFTRKSDQNMIEYCYEKLSRCNQAEMSNTKIPQWIVHRIGNNRYRNYLGPLSNYWRLSELLPHLISASYYIENDKERNVLKLSDSSAVKHIRSQGTSSSNKSPLICFRCRIAGHTSKECTKKTTMIGFQYFKPGHKSNECCTKNRA